MSTPSVAVVTGANTGIGKHIAAQLAEAGLRVYVGSRNAARGQAAVDELVARGLDARLLVLDVTAPETIEAAAALVEAESGHLDVLVNNAGISTGFEPPSQVTLEQLRETFETNVFGVVATTNAFLPLLRRSAGPRIVNVSSGLGSTTRLAQSVESGTGMNAVAYQASKAALNMISVSYAKELRAAGFKVNVMNPGLRATGLGGLSTPIPGAGDPAEGAAVATELALIGDDGPTAEFRNDDGTTIPW